MHQMVWKMRLLKMLFLYFWRYLKNQKPVFFFYYYSFKIFYQNERGGCVFNGGRAGNFCSTQCNLEACWNTQNSTPIKALLIRILKEKYQNYWMTHSRTHATNRHSSFDFINVVNKVLSVDKWYACPTFLFIKSILEKEIKHPPGTISRSTSWVGMKKVWWMNNVHNDLYRSSHIFMCPEAQKNCLSKIARSSGNRNFCGKNKTKK